MAKKVEKKTAKAKPAVQKAALKKAAPKPTVKVAPRPKKEKHLTDAAPVEVVAAAPVNPFPAVGEYFKLDGQIAVVRSAHPFLVVTCGKANGCVVDTPLDLESLDGHAAEPVDPAELYAVIG